MTAKRRLIVVYLALMAMTVGAIFLGHADRAGDSRPIGWLAIGALFALAFFKARLVLADFLWLRTAPGWLAGFSTALGLLVLALFGLALLG